MNIKSYTIYNLEEAEAPSCDDIVVNSGSSTTEEVVLLSKTDDVYALLRRRIVNGDYSAGYRLVIDALARETGVSPIPVREALRRLEAEGLVRHQPNVGAQVSGMDEDEYRQLMQVLARLDGWIFSLVSPRLTADVLSDLTRLVHEMSTALEQSRLTAYDRLDGLFHQRVRDLCPNTYLKHLAERTWDRLEHGRPNVFVSIPERARESLGEHYHIVQSLREHAPGSVLEGLVARHHMHTLEAYVEQSRASERLWQEEGGSI